MKLIGYSFKTEAIWIMIFNFGLPLLGLLIGLIFWFFG